MGSQLNDTWVWSGATSAWTQRAPLTPPPARASHALAFDSARGEVVLFGGYGAGGSYLNDTWVWSGATSAWTQRTPVTAPPVRSDHALAFDSARGEVVLFGGEFVAGAQRSYLSDTWVWNGATSAWTQRAPLTPPPARAYHALAFDSARGEVVLLAGYKSGRTYNDTWVWSGATSAWTERAPLTPPPARASHALAFDSARGEIVLFGGRGGASRLNDTWVWNGATSAWTERAPAPRGYHALAFDSARGEVVLFGGYDGSHLNDTWVWSGATLAWTQRASPQRPSARSSHALAFDSARAEVILFGGVGSSGRLNDTWAWSSARSAWSERAPLTPPAARDSHALAFDSARGEIVLFGGDGGGAYYLDDTWVWSGATSAWTQRAPLMSPPARNLHALAFDSARGEVVLFGGLGSASLNDTWVWSGATSAWTQRAPVAPPPARNLHALAFDSTRGEMVLFGGEGGSGALNDTWVWSGAASAWTQRAPLTPPPARSAHALAFDSARGEIVLFGGARPGALDFNDTWHHITLGGTCTTNEPCVGANAFCTDGVCCNVASCGTCQTCAGVTPGKCADVLNQEDADTCSARDGKSCSALAECKSALGLPAATAVACASGFLVDGVCCESAACAMCQTCDVTKKDRAEYPGRCGAARAGTDPHGDCSDNGAARCANNGACDGLGACQLYKAGTGCGDNACNGNRAAGLICSGLGTCQNDTVGVECTPYACRDGAGCATACAAKADCAPLHRCEGSVCVPDLDVRCEGDDLVSTSGERNPCGLYRCLGAKCVERCKSKLECARNADCNAAGACIVFETPPDDSASGGCSTTSADGGTLGTLATAMGIAMLRGRRRLSVRAKRASST